MKTLFCTIFLLGSLWVLDAAMFKGAYTQRVGWAAKRQADLLNQYVRRIVRKLD